MSELGQLIIVVATVFVAALYLTYRVWQTLRGRFQGGCSGCSGCDKVVSLQRSFEQARR